MTNQWYQYACESEHMIQSFSHGESFRSMARRVPLQQLLLGGLILSSCSLTYHFVGLVPAIITGLVLVGALVFDHFYSNEFTGNLEPKSDNQAQPDVITQEKINKPQQIEEPISQTVEEELDSSEKARRKKAKKELYRKKQEQRDKKKEQKELEELEMLVCLFVLLFFFSSLSLLFHLS